MIFPLFFPSSFDIKHPSGPVAAEVALLLDQMEQLAQGVGRSSRLGEVFFDRRILVEVKPPTFLPETTSFCLWLVGGGAFFG